MEDSLNILRFIAAIFGIILMCKGMEFPSQTVFLIGLATFIVDTYLLVT